mgnify:CR=1 FL=1|tara:strand:+ start:269 stop:493 length:225 start_codon:yes stop_codon:yes gene_type:complete
MALDNKVISGILGQFGALVLACIVLFWVSEQYKATLDLMMQRCEEDRELYHEQMTLLSEKLDAIHIELKTQRDN